MLEVKDLLKRYGDRTVLHHLNFSVEKGEVVGFLGPNGAGKTTTMRILTGFLPPTSGEVHIAGYDLQSKPIEVKRRIGYLPEQPPLYMDMTVKGYLRFISKLKGIRGDSLADRIDWAMQKCGLQEVQKRVIANLSKGFRQRVGLAQAILNEPELLILDEPTVGLDPRQIREIRSLIKELAGEHTVILSTHILSEVSMTCEKVMIINEGRLIKQGNIEEVTAGRSLEEVFIGLISQDETNVQ